jgi:hypothetical protein
MPSENSTQSSSRIGIEAYAHRNGDVKVGPREPGCSILPDGRVALSAALVQRLAQGGLRRRRRSRSGHRRVEPQRDA